ncbi:MAG: hypothetical protein GC202_10275 [Alphaproteobacteria bacterium]|nr:hypothetical protein [Alphaproteobacteria bacterium]
MNEISRHKAECQFISRPAELENARPLLARALAVWRAQCGGSSMPRPEQACFDDYTFAIGRLHLIEVREGGRFYYRVFGSRNHHLLGYHRHETSVIQPPSFRAFVERDLTDFLAAGAPVLQKIDIAIPARRCSYQRLMLPFGLPGGTVNLILACVDEENEADMYEVFRDPMFAVVPATETAGTNA